MKFAPIFVLLALAVYGCDNAVRTMPDGDNTAINERDRREAVAHDSAKTPLDQNENQNDIDITASIRKQVTDSNMSVDAQNIKIITQNGNVTLQGLVTTVDEKLQIETIARRVAGETRVHSQLDVAGSS